MYKVLEQEDGMFIVVNNYTNQRSRPYNHKFYADYVARKLQENFTVQTTDAVLAERVQSDEPKI